MPRNLPSQQGDNIAGVVGEGRLRGVEPVTPAVAPSTHTPPTTLTWLPWLLLTVLTMLGGGVSGQEVVGADPYQILGCHQRWYMYRVSKPYRAPNGTLYNCHDKVAVKSCWGRCDSSQIGDFQNPFKISRHPVCTYTGRQVHTYRLRYCDPGHPDPFTEIFDALGCTCSTCDPNTDTSCESLNGS